MYIESVGHALDADRPSHIPFPSSLELSRRILALEYRDIMRQLNPLKLLVQA